jgi:hypothetical protein
MILEGYGMDIPTPKFLSFQVGVIPFKVLSMFNVLEAALSPAVLEMA